MKISIRMTDELYDKLKEETERFGYRSFSAYIVTILEKRKVVEIEGGNQLALAIFELLKVKEDERMKEVIDRICQLCDLLMTEIEELKVSRQSVSMQVEMENFR